MAGDAGVGLQQRRLQVLVQRVVDARRRRMPGRCWSRSCAGRCAAWPASSRARGRSGSAAAARAGPGAGGEAAAAPSGHRRRAADGSAARRRRRARRRRGGGAEARRSGDGGGGTASAPASPRAAFLPKNSSPTSAFSHSSAVRGRAASRVVASATGPPAGRGQPAAAASRLGAARLLLEEAEHGRRSRAGRGRRGGGMRRDRAAGATAERRNRSLYSWAQAL